MDQKSDDFGVSWLLWTIQYMKSKNGRECIWNTVRKRNFKICFRQQTRVRSLECRKQLQCHFLLHSCICTWENKRSGSCFEHYCLPFLWQVLACLEFVKYQLGLRWNIPVFARCNVYISAIHITKTCLYNFDPLKPKFYIVKLGFTGVCIIFLILLKNIDCEYSLEPPRWGGSNEYPQSMFWAEIWKISEFFIWKFSLFWL